MSFILDALKKSELDRQRQAAPGMVESGIARHRARLPVWAIALGALLAVNLIVLAVVLTRSPPGSSPSAQAAAPDRVRPAAASETRAPAGESPTHFSPLDAPAEYAPEIPAAGDPAAGGPAADPGALSKAAPGPDVAAPAAARTLRRHDPTAGGPATGQPGAGGPVLAKDDYRPDEESLPTINEITQALPDLHLDVHVYATQPAQRFVFINMRKYHEGATLQEGPTIEHIRRDGVVLNYQGLRFLLPRQ